MRGDWSKLATSPKLPVVNEYKSFIKISRDKTFDEVANTWIFRLKQCTLPWRFDIAYLPEKSNHAVYAACRHPTLMAAKLSSLKIAEQFMVAPIHQ